MKTTMRSRPAPANIMLGILVVSSILLTNSARAKDNLLAAHCRSVTAATCKLAAELGRGINLGGMLEAPREGDYGLKVEPRFLDKAAERFTTVRLPVRWSNHASLDSGARIDPDFLARVDSIVDTLLAKGVRVILDLHHYSQLTGHPLYRYELRVDDQVVQPRFVSIWRQLAEHYKNHPPSLLFELYNEPNGQLDGEAWNKLLARTLPEIRRSNPDRAVLIGPTQWNAPRALSALKLPADPNLIVTVHHYEPFDFTHQGAEWVGRDLPLGRTCCDAAQTAAISSALDVAKHWSDSQGYPIHVGEFGSLDRAPMVSRVEYTRLVRREIELRGFTWTYWELASIFGVFDPRSNQWRQGLLDALIEGEERRAN